MKQSKVVAVAIALSTLIACSGGGGSSPPVDPPPPTKIQMNLIASGQLDPSVGVDAGASKIVRTQSDLNLLTARIQQNPGQTIDFAVNTVIYVEGPSINDPLSATRIRDASTANGVNTIVVESCATGGAAPGPFRSYAFYLAPASITAATLAPSDTRIPPNCTSVALVDPTRVAAGDLPLSVGAVVSPNRVVTSDAEYAFVTGRVPASALNGFTPNFSTTAVIYLEFADLNPASYIRVARVWQNDADKSVDVTVEICPGSPDMIPNHLPYSLYSIPKPAGPIRLKLISNAPPNCITTR